MSKSYPFPTVKLLAMECRARWPGYDKAAAATGRAEGALRRALLEAKKASPLLDPDSSLVLCGSFARHEMTGKSDYDWTLLIDGVVNNDHAQQAIGICGALQNAKLIEPGTSSLSDLGQKEKSERRQNM